MKDLNKKNTIMIVDDDSFMLDMYSIKFKERGFDVEPSVSPKQALEKLRGELSPIVILFDMVMPDVDGLEFLDIIKSEGLAKDTVLVAISNQWEESYVEKAKKLGVDDYIIKADTIPSELVSKVEKIIKSRNKN
jgi:two-component system chemotaxis sensor kinase CheA